MLLAYPLLPILRQKGENAMETVATVVRDLPSLRSGKFNWAFLTFWLTYLSVIAGLGYALLL
jgi:hypothetical protein